VQVQSESERLTVATHNDDATYVEDEEDLGEVRLPSRNHFLVVLRVKKARGWVPFALLDDFRLDICQRAAIEGLVSEVFQTDHHWSNSRRQLFDCLAYGIVEIFQQLPIQTPTEGGTDISAGQPKFDAVFLVGHRLLHPSY
jgi:hypothetical protein